VSKQRQPTSPSPGVPSRRTAGDKGAPERPTPTTPIRSSMWLLVWLALLVGLFAFLATTSKPASPAPASLTYATFLSKVAANDVKSVQIDQSDGVIDGQLTGGKAFTVQGPTGGLPGADLTLLDRHHVARDYAAPTTDIWPAILEWVLPLGLIVALWVWMGRRMRGQVSGLAGWSRSGARVHNSDSDTPGATFADVAGYEGVKQEIRELVEFLKEPARFREIGARIPKGVLLVGPPGTGKTLFARAVAGEAGVPFISITGSEFMEMFVGVGAARVRDLFGKARQQKPSIVFIDEIDAIGRKRGTGIGGGHDEREQTLNQILSEMDGFDPAEGIIVMAATNRPDVLDPALLRAGRFDRQVVVPLPTLEERRAILGVHCRGKQLAADAALDLIAKGTPGMSGADLENLVNEAALIAVRRGSKEITASDLEAAHDRVLLGLRRTSLVLGPEEKRIVAYHEAGHALLAELLPRADPVHKVTILPTGLSLGATQQLPDEEHQLQQLPMLEDALAVRLGGRAAEELVFGVPSTGAQDDLISATELAGRMVREWGMSEAIGEMAFGPRGPVFLGEDMVHTREYSEETARLIDEEISDLLGTQFLRAVQVLGEHRRALDALAGSLEAEETLEGEEIRQIIEIAGQVGTAPPASLRPVGDRPGGARPASRPNPLSGTHPAPGPTARPETHPAPGPTARPETHPAPGPTTRRNPRPSTRHTGGGRVA
jgi:cell division protease FtsH